MACRSTRRDGLRSDGELYRLGAERIPHVLEEDVHRTDVRQAIAGTPSEHVTTDTALLIINHPCTGVTSHYCKHTESAGHVVVQDDGSIKSD